MRDLRHTDEVMYVLKRETRRSSGQNLAVEIYFVIQGMTITFMRKRKVLYISGSRADYGLMRNALFEIQKSPNLELEVIACGMHLMPEFGRTIREIEKDKFGINKINAVYRKDSKESMAVFLGKLIQLLVLKIKKINPDIILLLGDRAEMLAGAIAGAYLLIPVAHIHGGDVSSTIDDSARHAITKLAHIHFPATKKSAERIIRMGEEKWRVNVVGAPGLDEILSQKLIASKEIAQKYGLNLAKPFLIVVQHPVTGEVNQAERQVGATMQSVRELAHQTIVIYPNADAGGRKMVKVIERYRKYPFIKIYKSVPRIDYLSLMKIAGALIGNSSSGIIESPSFNLPVVNIGSRQRGRERAENVIDADYKKEQIKKAITKALFDKKFIARNKKSKSPYGRGNAGKKIAGFLSNVNINEKLLNKNITY